MDNENLFTVYYYQEKERLIMKTRLKNWITTVLGVLFLVLALYLFISDEVLLNIIVCVAIGLGLMYAKDDLIRTLFRRI